MIFLCFSFFVLVLFLFFEEEKIFIYFVFFFRERREKSPATQGEEVLELHIILFTKLMLIVILTGFVIYH